MAGEGKNYIVGRGKLFFDQFASGSKTGTGELYLGNTPELSSTIDIETLDHFDADEGLNVKDESVTLENNLTLSFTTDNVSIENLALWYGGPATKLTVAAATGIEEAIPLAKRNRFYQLGVTAQTPMGARNLDNVVLSYDLAGVPTPLPAGNADIDLELGRIYIEPDAPDILDAGLALDVQYDVEESTSSIIIGRGDEIRGALKFLSKNPVGKQRNVFWPYVKLSPSGDYALKGSEWQQFSFSVEVLKKDSATERVYIEAVGD